jgi:hypothetical protein
MSSAYIDYIRVPHGDEAEAGFIDWFGTVTGWGFTKDGECGKKLQISQLKPHF